VRVARFERTGGLLVARAWIWGPRSCSLLSLAIDTASAETVVTPEIVERLGYSARDGERITTVRSAIGSEQGYTLHVKRFMALGFMARDPLVHVFELATGDEIDGLIGLSFLDQFNYEVRSREDRIRLERVSGW
jgi:predicted aspartyl protease